MHRADAEKFPFPHAYLVNSGNRTSLGLLFLCGALAVAPQAGRVGEDGSGSMWIAPELVGDSVPLQECVEERRARAQPLTFETVELSNTGTWPVEAPGARFEWNPRTGELGYTGAMPTTVFTDLEAVSLVAGRCGAPPSVR